MLERLGQPQREWTLAMCPTQRIELRRQGSLWLKLVYSPDDQLRAAGIFLLAQHRGKAGKAGKANKAQQPVALRWAGLAPGMDGRTAYPESGDWRPFFWNLGAKQWLWLEALEPSAESSAREHFLGGVVVDTASGFAAGKNFPHDVAEAAVVADLAGSLHYAGPTVSLDDMEAAIAGAATE